MSDFCATLEIEDFKWGQSVKTILAKRSNAELIDRQETNDETILNCNTVFCSEPCRVCLGFDAKGLHIVHWHPLSNKATATNIDRLTAIFGDGYLYEDKRGHMLIWRDKESIVSVGWDGLLMHYFCQLRQQRG